MSDSGGVDKGLLALIQGVLGGGRTGAPAQFEPAPNPPAAAPPALPVAPQAEAPVELSEPARAEPESRRKTAADLESIILRALQTLDGAPKAGFVVTVYGSNPWNAMLTIKPEAGRIADPALWRGRVREMAVRLRQDYDLAEE
ncbi:MAG TPA: hypothetical protein VHC94_20005 [Nitrobacter sp.]|nr:hypothetical protein [Nitrobacter sp.]